MHQEIKKEFSTRGGVSSLVRDRVRVIGDNLPKEGVVFLGRPILPLRAYRETAIRGFPYKYAIDAEDRCWATQEWLGGLNLVTYSILSETLLSNDNHELIKELEVFLGKASPVKKCPTCGCIVPKGSLKQPS